MNIEACYLPLLLLGSAFVFGFVQLLYVHKEPL